MTEDLLPNFLKTIKLLFRQMCVLSCLKSIIHDFAPLNSDYWHPGFNGDVGSFLIEVKLR